MRPGDSGQQFQGEERNTPGGDFCGCLRIAQRIGHGDYDLVGSIALEIVFSGDRICAGGANLEDYVGGKEFVAGGNDFSAFSWY